MQSHAQPPSGGASGRDDDLADEYRIANDLAIIRSAAEILRDVPDLEPAERIRFAVAVLEGERRLEALLQPGVPRTGR